MVLGGKRKIYDNLVSNALEELPIEPQQDLKTKRTTLMVSRYYYYAVLCRKRYDDCLADLSQEFFLSPLTISRHINGRLGYLENLKDRKTDRSDLKKKYPWLAWH
ncbi:hypothetical protein [Croceivirga sp. JEA036]|uniref:hypothetical protein n=1 Tax=Croceivirga sp. JEA036 TaxID=2721162 RepID=UPI001438FCD5|nr:hypothetical protein [Croceivirga sp. JEA036]NJB36377.1 hypothetical protein [Croceivirga sp. JEA036]